MIEKYLGNGAIDVSSSLEKDSELKKVAIENIPVFHSTLKTFHYHRALEAAWKIISSTNRFLETMAPWTLAKQSDPESQQQLKMVLVHSLESLRIVSLLALPFLPDAAAKALGFLGDNASLNQSVPMDLAIWGKGPPQVSVTKGAPLFPRLEMKELA